MDTDALNEIQIVARILADRAPEHARNYWQAVEGLNLDRQHEELTQFIQSDLHSMRSWHELCFQDRERMTELAKLVIVHLPDLSCEYVRINPPWRFDQRGLEWKPIVAELRKIEETAIRKLLTSEPPRIRISLAGENVVIIDGESIAVKPNGFKLFQLLLENPGQYVPVSQSGIRTRDVQSLPVKLRDAVESDPGAGTRIKPEWTGLASATSGF
jgi:hypothetical protein